MFALLLTFCLIALPVTNAALGAEDKDYKVTFDGMDFVAPEGDETIKVTVDNLQSYSYDVKASSGKINGSSSNAKGSTTDGTFSFKYTASKNLGNDTITVKITSSEITGGELTRTYTMKVINVYQVSVNVKNTGGMSVEVPVNLYIDGKLYRTDVLEIKASDEATKLTLDVNAGALKGGQHNYEIVIDEKYSGLISFGDSEQLSAKGTFYTGDGGWGIISIVLSILVVVLVILFIYLYFNRGKKKKHKK